MYLDVLAKSLAGTFRFCSAQKPKTAEYKSENGSASWHAVAATDSPTITVALTLKLRQQKKAENLQALVFIKLSNNGLEYDR